MGGGGVEALFGLGDVAEEGVEVVEDPVVAEWSQEAVGVRAGGACCDGVAEGERGVGGEDPAAAEVPRMRFVEELPALVEQRDGPVGAAVLDQHERQG